MLTTTGLGGHFGLNQPNQFAARLVERLGQFEDGCQRGLLLAKFKDADVGTTQVSLEAERLLRQAGLLP